MPLPLLLVLLRCYLVFLILFFSPSGYVCRFLFSPLSLRLTSLRFRASTDKMHLLFAMSTNGWIFFRERWLLIFQNHNHVVQYWWVDLLSLLCQCPCVCVCALSFWYTRFDRFKRISLFRSPLINNVLKQMAFELMLDSWWFAWISMNAYRLG